MSHHGSGERGLLGAGEWEREKGGGQKGNQVKRDTWAVTYGLYKQVARQCQCWQGCFLVHLLLKSGNWHPFCLLCACSFWRKQSDISILHSFGFAVLWLICWIVSIVSWTEGWGKVCNYPTALSRQASTSWQDLKPLLLTFSFFKFLSIYCSSIFFFFTVLSFSYLLLIFLSSLCFPSFFPSLSPSG